MQCRVNIYLKESESNEMLKSHVEQRDKLISRGERKRPASAAASPSRESSSTSKVTRRNTSTRAEHCRLLQLVASRRLPRRGSTSTGAMATKPGTNAGAPLGFGSSVARKVVQATGASSHVPSRKRKPKARRASTSYDLYEENLAFAKRAAALQEEDEAQPRPSTASGARERKKGAHSR